MKFLELKEHILYFDDEDFEKVKNSKIRIRKSRDKISASITFENKVYSLHKFILNETRFKIKVLDGNRLNLQKNNLQLVIRTKESDKQNQKRYYSNNKEKYTKQSAKWYKEHPEKAKIEK